jgi:hypothetical protein
MHRRPQGTALYIRLTTRNAALCKEPALASRFLVIMAECELVHVDIRLGLSICAVGHCTTHPGFSSRFGVGGLPKEPAYHGAGITNFFAWKFRKHR